MRKIERLRKEALESCKFRGHEMEKFRIHKTGSFRGTIPIKMVRKMSSTCTICGREVTINVRPLPNEIEIGGEAVALNCEGWPLMFGLANLRLAQNR